MMCLEFDNDKESINIEKTFKPKRIFCESIQPRSVKKHFIYQESIYPYLYNANLKVLA